MRTRLFCGDWRRMRRQPERIVGGLYSAGRYSYGQVTSSSFIYSSLCVCVRRLFRRCHRESRELWHGTSVWERRRQCPREELQGGGGGSRMVAWRPVPWPASPPSTVSAWERGSIARDSLAQHTRLSFFLYFSVTASLSLFIFFFLLSFFLGSSQKRKKEKKNFRKKEKQSTPPALEPKTLALFQTFPPPVRLYLSLTLCNADNSGVKVCSGWLPICQYCLTTVHFPAHSRCRWWAFNEA